MRKYFVLIFHFQFFLFGLNTNKARKLEVAESNLIMEKIPNSLFISLSRSLRVLVGISVLLFRVHVLSLALSLPLFLLNSFCCCRSSADVMWREFIGFYPNLKTLQSSSS